MASPMPRVPPVTSARLPVNSVSEECSSVSLHWNSEEAPRLKLRPPRCAHPSLEVGMGAKVPRRPEDRKACQVVQCEVRAERGAAQNRNAGKDPGALTSVETLISRQRSASAARAASAWPANCTASLPSRRWAGRRSLAARRQDDLRHPGRIARLLAPERLERLDDRADGRFILREQLRGVLVRTSAPVRPHAAGFERTYL